MDFIKTLKFIPYPYNKKIRWLIAGAFVKALLDFIGTAALISVMVLILGSSKYSKYILLIAILGILIIGLKNIFTLYIERCRQKYLLSLYRYFSTQMIDNYYSRGLPYIKERGVSQIAHHINFVCLSFVLQVISPIFNFISETILLSLIIIALTIYSPLTIAIIIASFTPIIIGYAIFVRKRISQCGKEENIARRKQLLIIQELFKGYAEIEINKAYPLMKDKFNTGLNDISNHRIRLDLLQKIPTSLIEIGTAITIFILIIITPNTTSLAVTLGVFGVAALRLLPCVRVLLAGWLNIQNQAYTQEIIKSALQDINKPTEPSTPITFNKTITINKLNFSYNASNPILEDINLQIQKGEIIGIKGVSGRGKTTLFNILLGFYPPIKGEILIDGTPLTAANKKDWHKKIGYVPQDVFIMNSSIIENITLQNDTPIDYNKIRSVLSKVKLLEWAESLPQKLETTLGENGSMLSGGQKQRISIARALYKGAEVLFFDEATSALDSDTENEILKVIKQLSTTDSNITLFIIAHRESSLKMCNKIITL